MRSRGLALRQDYLKAGFDNGNNEEVCFLMVGQVSLFTLHVFHVRYQSPNFGSCSAVCVILITRQLQHCFLSFFKFRLWCFVCLCSEYTFVIFSERELMFMFAICRRPSVCLSVVCLSSVCLSVCLSSVTFVHPTQPIEIFGNVSTPFGTLAICDPSVKILRRSSQGNASVGGLNQSGVEKCSDFGPLEDCISETMQDKR